MPKISFQNDSTRALEEAEGSDGRLNVSSRSDARSYYNSRDVKRTFSVAFDMQSAAVGEYFVYWKNTSTTRELVISDIGFNSIQNARIKLWFVTGTSSAGNVMIPTNLNRQSSNAAESEAREGGGAASGIGGLTADALIDFAYVGANGHEEFHLKDRLRLGEGDAIALEYDEGTDGDISGAIFGFFEDAQ